MGGVIREVMQLVLSAVAVARKNTVLRVMCWWEVSHSGIYRSIMREFNTSVIYHHGGWSSLEGQVCPKISSFLVTRFRSLWTKTWPDNGDLNPLIKTQFLFISKKNRTLPFTGQMLRATDPFYNTSYIKWPIYTTTILLKSSRLAVA